MTSIKKYLKITPFIFTPFFLYLLISNINQQFFYNFINSSGYLGPLFFIIFYIVSVLLFFPASLLSIMGGLLFGIFWGTIYSIFSATIAAGIAFLSVNYISKLKTKKKESENERVNRIKKMLKNKGFITILFFRFLFLPYIALSYAAGLVKELSFKDFMLATVLSNLVGGFIFVYFGNNLKYGLKGLILPIILIALVLIIPLIIRKTKRLTF